MTICLSLCNLFFRIGPLELQYLLRLIKKDLRINAGVKHILDGGSIDLCISITVVFRLGVDVGAYDAFQSCRDLEVIVTHKEEGKAMPSGVSLSTPILPMLVTTFLPIILYIYHSGIVMSQCEQWQFGSPSNRQ